MRTYLSAATLFTLLVGSACVLALSPTPTLAHRGMDMESAGGKLHGEAPNEHSPCKGDFCSRDELIITDPTEFLPALPSALSPSFLEDLCLQTLVQDPIVSVHPPPRSFITPSVVLRC